MKNLMLTITAVIVPLFWILSTPKSRNNFRGYETTNSQILKTQNLVELFKKQYQRLPMNLNEIRVFSLAQNQNYIPYDGYAKRLLYQQITRSQYLIKSFGADASADTTSSAQDDLIFSNIPELPSHSLIFNPPSDKISNIYPSVCLLGCQSPDSTLVAALYINPSQETKQLIVRNKLKKNFIMIAPHPKVDEYLWISSENPTLVYTAMGHAKYRDGIYLWDLSSNTTINILDSFESSKTLKLSENTEQKYYCSLSAFNASQNDLYLFLVPRKDSLLNPKEFYSNKNLFKLNFSNKNKTNPKLIRTNPQNPSNALMGIFSTTPYIYGDFEDGSIQKLWSQLPLNGNMQGVLEEWQEFSMTHTSSPLFPYSLWWLGTIYSEAFRITHKTSIKHSQTLRAFGAELSAALARINSAPSYLQAMGGYINLKLIQSQPLDFKTTDIPPPTKNDLIKF